MANWWFSEGGAEGSKDYEVETLNRMMSLESPSYSTEIPKDKNAVLLPKAGPIAFAKVDQIFGAFPPSILIPRPLGFFSIFQPNNRPAEFEVDEFWLSSIHEGIAYYRHGKFSRVEDIRKLEKVANSEMP